MNKQDQGVLSSYPYLDAKEERSFARFTIENRFPKILHDIVSSNEYSSDINQSLKALSSSVASHCIQELPTIDQSNSSWKSFLECYEGQPITAVPFFFAEIYFYELILHLTGYESNKTDPFFVIKSQETRQNLDAFHAAVEEMESVTMSQAIRFSLTGNSADLSQLSRGDSRLKIIIDHSEQLMADLSGAETVHMILDNSGQELFSDLMLALTILRVYPQTRIRIYPKSRPVFVSDTTMDDIELLMAEVDPKLAREIEDYQSHGRFAIVAHEFWNDPMYFTTLSDYSAALFDRSDVLISKGDANYRRFYEDRDIPDDFTGGAKLTEKQFALRTLKSEIIAGLSLETSKELTRQDASWQSNGKYAVIQKLI